MPTLTPTRERIKEKAKARSEAKQSKTAPKIKSKKIKSFDTSFNLERFLGTLFMLTIFVALVSFGTYNFLHFAAFGFDKNYQDIKRCLNNGGKWDYKVAKCSK